MLIQFVSLINSHGVKLSGRGRGVKSLISLPLTTHSAHLAHYVHLVHVTREPPT